MDGRDPSHIVMVGTDPATRGGIASVVAAWRSGGLFRRWPIAYVASHRDGPRRGKLAAGLAGLLAWIGIAWREGRGVLHVHAASRWSFWRKSLFMAGALFAGWPIVFHLHGGGFARFHAACGPLGRAAVRFFLDRATVIVVVSSRWAAWMHGVTSNPRIAVIPNPVELPPPTGIARETGTIAFAGRCEEAKGIFDLFEAVAALRPVLPRARIECAGDGDHARLERRAGSLGLGSRVRMRGWLDPRERERLLARATVFVMPSHAEGMPMSLLEAMAAGCPVIATTVGGIPDLVQDGVNGLLVPPRSPGALAEALRRVLGDRELALRLGREARATVAARFTVARSLERLEQIYAGLGVPRGPRRALAAAHRLQESS